jgi:hypothetical protein
MTSGSDKSSYEVLNPWAEVDPVNLRGLNSPRPTDLSGKTIGLFHNWKRAARPMLESLEKHLKARYPDARLSRYSASGTNTPEIESNNKSKYEEWLKGLDAVVFTYGD